MHRRPLRGYTLIELMVVMVVLGILASAAYPLAEITVRRDRERELKRSLWEIRDAIDAYKRASDAGMIAVVPGSAGYPPSLEALVVGAPNLKDGGKMRYFLRRIPRDPFADEGVAPEKSWGLRSFDSPPELLRLQPRHHRRRSADLSDLCSPDEQGRTRQPCGGDGNLRFSKIPQKISQKIEQKVPFFIGETCRL